MTIVVCGKPWEFLEFSSSFINPMKRRILLLLSRGPLPSKHISEHLNLSEKNVLSYLKELLDAGLVEGIDKEGLKFYVSVHLVLFDSDIEDLKAIHGKLADEFWGRFTDIVAKNHKAIERSFLKNEGRYTLGRIVAHLLLQVFGSMVEKARTEIKREDERIVAQISSEE